MEKIKSEQWAHVAFHISDANERTKELCYYFVVISDAFIIYARDLSLEWEILHRGAFTWNEWTLSR